MSEEDTVPTEEEAKKISLAADLKAVQSLYWKGKNEEAEVLLTEKLKFYFNIDLLDLRDKVAIFVKDNAADLATQVPYIVPNGDWSKCVNDDEGKQKFLEEEGAKSDQWHVKALANTHLPKVWAVKFSLDSMESADDGIIGYAYVSEAGVVKHIFAQGE
jgi:hypothetical protein